MTAPVRPASVKAFQREKWMYVPTLTSQTAPSLAEIVAAGSLDLSCYLFDDFGRPAQNTNRVTLDRRVCDGGQYEQIGVTTYTGGDAWYVVDPQAAAGSTGKKALEKLPDGTTGFLVRRLGIDVQTDFAVGQFASTFPVAFGPPMETKHGDGETSEVSIQQTWAITGPPTFIKAIVT